MKQANLLVNLLVDDRNIYCIWQKKLKTSIFNPLFGDFERKHFLTNIIHFDEYLYDMSKDVFLKFC